jgi:hypothetical protein
MREGRNERVSKKIRTGFLPDRMESYVANVREESTDLKAMNTN